MPGGIVAARNAHPPALGGRPLSAGEISALHDRRNRAKPRWPATAKSVEQFRFWNWPERESAPRGEWAIGLVGEREREGGGRFSVHVGTVIDTLRQQATKTLGKPWKEERLNSEGESLEFEKSEEQDFGEGIFQKRIVNLEGGLFELNRFNKNSGKSKEVKFKIWKDLTNGRIPTMSSKGMVRAEKENLRRKAEIRGSQSEEDISRMENIREIREK
ncbi:hypothetical protein K0M31_009516 [Melipona bicolor]|uniref:Uncharacterized protein n=1 Tax=Melipona bicolor TaxID=60889 RepID=A0AA40FNC6_9HYME|nr:hypothetical protein K0M31_009516 [Melipona bicolor]